MTIWISAYLKRPLDLGTDEIGALLDGEDWHMFAENQDLDPDEGARTRARFRVDAGGEGNAYFVRYRTDPGWFISADHVRGEGALRELQEHIEHRAVPARVLPRLERTVQIVHFALKQSDADGMGWPICFALAMNMARLVGGVVNADGTYWDPHSYRAIS